MNGIATTVSDASAVSVRVRRGPQNIEPGTLNLER